MNQHPLSACFPSMPPAEFDALVNDIGVNGLRTPIVTYEGMVLDGWHRFRACERAKVRPKLVEFRKDDPVAFVKSVNWHRRHMTESQRAAAVVAMRKWRGTGADSKGGGAPGSPPPETVADMAKEAGVSERTIQQAKKVETNGTHKLKQAVTDGDISIKRAAAVAELPPAQQDKALAAPPPKKEKPPEPPDTSLADELKSADREITKLTALVESLRKPDLAKEVEAWSLKFAQLEGRLQQQITTCNEATKQAKYGTNLLEKIRKALHVVKNAEILPTIEACKCRKK